MRWQKCELRGFQPILQKVPMQTMGLLCSFYKEQRKCFTLFCLPFFAHSWAYLVTSSYLQPPSIGLLLLPSLIQKKYQDFHPLSSGLSVPSQMDKRNHQLPGILTALTFLVPPPQTCSSFLLFSNPQSPLPRINLSSFSSHVCCLHQYECQLPDHEVFCTIQSNKQQ